MRESGKELEVAPSLQLIPFQKNKNKQMMNSSSVVTLNYMFDYEFEKGKNFAFYFPKNNKTNVVETNQILESERRRLSHNNKKNRRESKFSNKYGNLITLRKLF